MRNCCSPCPSATASAPRCTAALTLEAALAKAERGTAKTLVVLENDLYRRALPERVDRALGAANVVVLDSIETRTTEAATLVLAGRDVRRKRRHVRELRRPRTTLSSRCSSPRIRSALHGAGLPTRPRRLGRNELGWRHIDELVAACDAQRARSPASPPRRRRRTIADPHRVACRARRTATAAARRCTRIARCTNPRRRWMTNRRSRFRWKARTPATSAR